MIGQPLARTLVTKPSFEDDFSDADNTVVNGKSLDIGNTTWTTTTNSANAALKTVNGRATIVLTTPTDATTYIVGAFVDSGSANIRMSIDANMYNSAAVTESCFLRLRYTDINNYWFIGTLSFGADPDRHGIMEVTSGTSTERASFTNNFSYGTWPLICSASGNSLSGTINGTTTTYSSSVRNTVTTHGFSVVRFYNSVAPNDVSWADNFKLFVNRT